MRIWVLLAGMLLAGFSGYAGQVGMPVERIALPGFEGDLLVCIWDDSTSGWLGEPVALDAFRSRGFRVPERGRWYWVGIWDVESKQYVFGKWVGHF